MRAQPILEALAAVRIQPAGNTLNIPIGETVILLTLSPNCF